MNQIKLKRIGSQIVKEVSDILLTLIDFRFCYGQNLYLKSKMIHLAMCKERRMILCLQ